MVVGKQQQTITEHMAGTKKELGQHWLRDRRVLSEIAASAALENEDTVLEIGPGLGTLTSELLRHAKKVVAVEYDADLARKLPGQFPGTALTVEHADILTYDLSQMPPGYKVVANIPYYITAKIVDMLVRAHNSPSLTVLLVQKEVAERLAASPGNLSLLAINAQVYTEPTLGLVVGREYFSPPPEVDSQVVILRRRSTPLVSDADERMFWRVVRAGFAAKRKKLRSSLAAGLGLEKTEIETLLGGAKIDQDLRAQDLSIEDWLMLSKVVAGR